MKTCYLLFLALGACTSSIVPPAPKTPAQAVFELKSAEGAALVIAAKYDALPPCGTPTSPVLCSDPKVVATIRAKDAVAAKAIDAAEAAAQTAGYSADTTTLLINTATIALAGLEAEAMALQIK
jgi:hypothetical protein